jgi:hypothetical protein
LRGQQTLDVLVDPAVAFGRIAAIRPNGQHVGKMVEDEPRSGHGNVRGRHLGHGRQTRGHARIDSRRIVGKRQQRAAERRFVPIGAMRGEICPDAVVQVLPRLELCRVAIVEPDERVARDPSSALDALQ